jgi:hypothetical protein
LAEGDRDGCSVDSGVGNATIASFSFLMVADLSVYCIEPKEVVVPAGGGDGGSDVVLEERLRLED